LLFRNKDNPGKKKQAAMAFTDLIRIDGLRQIRQKKNNAFNPNFYEKSGSSE